MLLTENKSEIIMKISQICSSDPMNRVLPTKVKSADLEAASKLILSSNNIAILTGFPIISANVGESDGPLGAVSMGYCFEKIGKKVTLITDPISHKILSETATAAELTSEIISVPLNSSKRYCEELVKNSNFDLLITIERASKAKEGKFFNMRGIDISDFVSDTDSLLDCSFPVISIGDGGNECGMGNFEDEIAKFVPNGEKIASNTKCDYPFVGGISNYFAWGISAAISILLNQDVMADERTEREMFARLCEAGGVDGTKGIVANSVDGQDIEEYFLVYKEIRKIMEQ